ncbi:MAG TPA: hypothetical protein VHH36_07160, partial [Candidatus Thermoplasmatota archaeon]|nr:hypothetical protein [Candidatus Thermoplasmatota archaeon]
PHGPVEPVADAGEVAGAFSDSWKIHVPDASVGGLLVHFNLTGAQAGLPPTARLFVVFRDPAGGLMGQATLGLGGDGDAVHWRYGPSSVIQAGDYVLEATAADTGLPSGGLARYEVYLGAL